MRKSFKICSDDRLERSNSDDSIVLDQFFNKLATCLGMPSVRLLLSSILRSVLFDSKSNLQNKEYIFIRNNYILATIVIAATNTLFSR